jgi:glycosyltransferase involved in cell wall biosynthesis
MPASKLRILIAIGVARQAEAGAASVLLNHARELERSGHEVETWFLEDALPQPSRGKRFEALLFANAVAKRILSGKHNFDVVNIHAPWGCVYGVRRKFARRGEAPPYVMTMQGSERHFVRTMALEDRKGKAANFGWKNRLWHRAYHQVMYDISIRSADYGAIACEEGRQEAEEIRGENAGRMRFVPNGVEERFFVAREFAEKSVLRLLYVGTWLDRKGVYYLTEGFGLLAAQCTNVRLTVAGCLASEEQVRQAFAREVRDRIEVIPFVKREDMPALYAGHDVFVFPSLVEGMPLTLLEAMATAMPSVTTNVCGMADVVEDRVNGMLVPPADAKALAQAIEQLAGSVKLRGELGQAAQERARALTWERVTRRLEETLALAASNVRAVHAASVSAARVQGEGETH